MGLSLTFIRACPLLLSFMGSAQFVYPPTGFKTTKGAAGVNVRYKRVPHGICEPNPKVKSFAGYSDIGTDQHIFWWFFEAKENPQDKPLTIWLNGGPGASSVSHSISDTFITAESVTDEWYFPWERSMFSGEEAWFAKSDTIRKSILVDDRDKYAFH